MSSQPATASSPFSIVQSLAQARALLPPAEFQDRLRRYLLDNPQLTLRAVAQELGVTRQRVALMVGRLNRPTCARSDRPAPKREDARRRMADLRARVAAGEPAELAARALSISLPMAMKLGFRARAVRPSHGTKARAASGCGCWRCRRAAGIALPRGPRMAAETRARIEDWLAWVDPETGQGLTQKEIGRLAGVAQGRVSRIARVL